MADPLHCAVCQAPATVHLTQIAQGKIHKVHLCEACAAKGGALDAPVFHLTELLGLPKGHAANLNKDVEPAKVGAHCPTCGLAEAEFKKLARFGCTDCYGTFAGTVAALIPRIQPGSAHRGKHPAGARIHAARTELAALRLELKTAIKNEKYESAARARDAIKTLEEEIARIERAG